MFQKRQQTRDRGCSNLLNLRGNLLLGFRNARLANRGIFQLLDEVG
jgi:hypothetical protein